MKNKLLSIQHYVSALTFMLIGFDNIHHEHSIIGWTILLFGIIVLSYFIYLKLSKNPNSRLEFIIYIFESIALFFTSYLYFQQGKSLLPYVTIIAAFGFLIAAFINFK